MTGRFLSHIPDKEPELICTDGTSPTDLQGGADRSPTLAMVQGESTFPWLQGSVGNVTEPVPRQPLTRQSTCAKERGRGT